MYERFLVEKRNPEDAEEMLHKIMANILYQEKISSRVQTFGRFMNISHSTSYSIEALNVYLTTLTMVNYGLQPILPHDSTHVDFNRLVAGVEHISLAGWLMFASKKLCKKQKSASKFGT